jgi:small subunit ribosomal protein S1
MEQHEPPVGEEAAAPIPETTQPPDQPAEEMQELAFDETSMESLLEQEELDIDFPQRGEIRKGTIVSISADEVLISVGAKSEGIIPRKELEQIDPTELEKLSEGETISVYVVTPEDSQGNLLLSYVRALEEKDWQRAEDLLESGEVFEGEIEGYNKGGLIVPLGLLRGFVPSSQVSLSRRMAYRGKSPDQRWGKMVGEPIATRVIEVDRSRRRLILSERAALQEARELLKERLLDELEVGDVRDGRVTSLADFGAFVNINGADGLVHLTELSWERVNNPGEVLKVGQDVRVKVIEIDHDRKRIGLSIRQLQEDPWPDKIAGLKVGQLVEGEIVRLVKFGAFARLVDYDVEGLIHISELSEDRIEHPKEILQEGDVQPLRVINIDEDRRRIGLSVRKVDSPAFADLDWKLALAEEADDLEQEEPEATADAGEITEEVDLDETSAGQGEGHEEGADPPTSVASGALEGEIESAAETEAETQSEAADTH